MEERNFSSSRIAKNTIALYFRSFISMIIGLYSSRVLLNELGVEDFGIYQAVGGMVALFSFLNSTMLVSSQRFLNYEMGRNNPQGIREVFCMSMNIQILLAIIICILCEILGIYAVQKILIIPEERLDAALWVTHFSIFALFVTIISVPYNSLIIAKEEMRSFAYIDILGSILKLTVVLMLGFLDFDSLIIYSALIVFVQFVLFYLYRLVCKQKFEEANYKLIWNRNLFFKMMGFSGWTTLSSVTYIGRIQGIIVMYNAFCGVIISAALGIANQINNAITTLVNNFTMSFNPQLTKNYASGDIHNCKTIHQTGPKFSFFLISVISSPLLINAKYLLQIWLKNVPYYTDCFIWLILGESLFRALISTPNTVIRATGKVKDFELICTSIQMGFLILAYICFRHNTNIFLPYGCLVVSVLIMGGYLVYRSCRILAMSPLKYYLNVHIRMLLPYSLLIVALYLFMPKADNFPSLLLYSIIIIIATIVVEYYGGFDKQEKNFINRFIVKIVFQTKQWKV